MNISNFSKDELATIEEFLQASNVISNIYNNLYELEIQGKKDSNDYNKLLRMLKDAIKIEDEKYKEADLSAEEAAKIIELLAKSPSTLKINNIDSIIQQKDSDKVTRRVINILADKIITSIDFSRSTIPNEIFELLREFGLPIDDETAYNNLSNYYKVELAINNDFLIVFLSILQESSAMFKYSQYKKELIKAMYTTSFINKNIEAQLIESKFDISNNLYVSSKFINELLRSDSTVYNILKQIKAEIQVRSHIADLVLIRDVDYSNPTTNISSIITQCYIRALLTFMDDDLVYKVNEQFHELVDDPAYIKKFPTDRISENAIVNCFKSINHDRAKKRTISFNPKNQK